MRSTGKRLAAIVAERSLAMLSPVLAPSRPRQPGSGKPAVLLIRCDHIGDAVMATAIISGLRASLDPARLDVLAAPWSAAIFAGHPAVDRVVDYATPWWLAARGQPLGRRLRAWLRLPGLMLALRRGRYDVGIDLRGDLRHILFFLVLGGVARRVGTDRTGGRALLTDCWAFDPRLHEVEKNAAIVGLLGVTAPPSLMWAEVGLDPAIARRLDSIAGRQGFVTFSLQGTEANRSWPPDAAAQVIARLANLGFGAAYLGGPGDRAVGEAIRRHGGGGLLNLAGETTLPQTLAVLRRAAAAVAVDSGPMHMAAAAGAPLVALFGAGDPAQARPWTDRAVILTDGAPCGCVHPKCDFNTGGPGRCMTRITPEQVLDALARLMQRPA